MPLKLSYAIKYVADMDRAVKFYRDTLGLMLKFESPHWTEFVTGETTLALHPASEKNPAGSVEIGFNVGDLDAFHKEMSARGVEFPVAPRMQFGAKIGKLKDCEGANVGVSGK